MERAQGFAMQGARVVWTHGLSSQTVVQETAPLATITVYITGTTTLATLYSDNQVPPTHMANPFTANYNGYWFFYAQDGRYDVMIESPEWNWTIGDLLLQDPGRWTADQNANGHWLHNLGGISFVNNLNPMCASPQMWMDQNCNLLITGGQGEVLWSLAPNGDMRIAGCLTTPCIHLNNGTCAESITLDSQCRILFSNGISVPSILLNNSTCQSTITFDAGCRVEITGPGLSVDGYLNVVGGSQFDGPIALNGPLVTDVNANGHAITGVSFLGAQALHMADGPCSVDVGFDARCYLVFYGSVGVNNNLDVNGFTNLAGNLKVDGSFELDGPWATDQNANGKSLTGLNILGVSAIHLIQGSCAAQIGFDANCNVVLAGNLKVTGSLDAGGINSGLPPSPPSYPGITAMDVLVQGGSGTARVFRTIYQNNFSVPMYVVACCNLGPHDGVVAWCAANSPPGVSVSSILSQSEDFTLIMPVSFWVLPGYYYYLDDSGSQNPLWPPIINSWIEWH